MKDEMNDLTNALVGFDYDRLTFVSSSWENLFHMMSSLLVSYFAYMTQEFSMSWYNTG